ncbi:hypothetical protein D3C71_594750 [compost metagenome]
MLEVVITAHRLIHAEGAHEAISCRRHAVAGVGVEVVRSEASAHQFCRGIPFENRPLAGAEHSERCRPLFLQGLLGLLGHDVEGFFPGDGFEFAFLVKDVVAFA